MSKSDQVVFLESIRADPADATARLILADYLDERGDPDGELVRLLCEVQQPQETECPTCKRGRGLSTCPDCCASSRILVAAYQPGPAWKRLEALTGGLDAEIDRLSPRDQRLFACDCIARVLPLYEAECPGDERPRRAVETARRYAVGEAQWEELESTSHCARSFRNLPQREARRIARGAMWCIMSGEFAGHRAIARCASEAAAEVRGPAEQRWQLCRAVEYRLEFVAPPTFSRG